MQKFESPSIAAVMRADLCAGCGLCAGISDGAVAMLRNEKGFLRPAQRAALGISAEAIVAKACPGLSVERSNSAAKYHPIFGGYEEAFLGWSTDPALRHHGSSGAALSAIGHSLISSGRVKFILTIRDDEDDPVSNRTHEVRNYEDVYTSAGSRYGPSSPLSEIGQYLDGAEQFAIIAKPCDISALRALSKVDKRVNEKVAVFLSFYCAGVPSRDGALEIINAMGVAEEDVKRFQFRGDGWPGYAKAVRRDGSEAKMSYNDSWGKILTRHLQLRCKLCPDGTAGSADVVCADAWHSDAKGYPVFDDAEGRSLVMARTDLGLELVYEAVSTGLLELKDFDMSELARIQIGQTGRSRALLARLIGFVLKKGMRPKYSGFSILQNARSLGFVSFIRNLLGTFRRA